MPIIRNPFRSKDENQRPPTAVTSGEKPVSGSQPVEITKKEKEPAEYKLSEINDSGVYLPPSPPERKGFWHTNSSRSTTSSNHRSVFNENEPFNISRESFDSYRRSFDISARSPITTPSERPRASLDSRTFQQPPRTSSSLHRPGAAPIQPTPESDFEDVGLDDPKPQAQPVKKRGIFSRLTESASSSSHRESGDGNQSQTGSERPASSGSPWHHFGSGRKRGQSGQGSELGSLPIVKKEEAKESGLRHEPQQQQAEEMVEPPARENGTPKPPRSETSTPKPAEEAQRAEESDKKVQT
ncbi:hypothetical protein MBLNU230_g1055t1 [Neophaeotheca triangularis]